MYYTIGLILGILIYLFLLIHPFISKLRKKVVEYKLLIFDASNYIEEAITYKSEYEKSNAIGTYLLLNLLVGLAICILSIYIWPIYLIGIIGTYFINKEITNN
jgi:hypothetical protein